MKFFRSFLSAAAMSATLLAGHPAAHASQPENIINAEMRLVIGADVAAHAKAFSGSTAVPPAFLTAIAGKRLVGLGEGSHGASEAQTFNASVILALAKKGRVVVFYEDQFGSVVPINSYIQGAGAEADINQLVGGLTPVHVTQEIATFFKAARKFNATAPAGAKIEVYGVDNQIYAGPPDFTAALQAFSVANSLSLDAEIAVCANFIQVWDAYTPENRAAFIGAAAKIQQVVSNVAPSVAGQVEAAVMANTLVYYIAQDAANNSTYGYSYVDMLYDTPATIAVQGIRDAGMASSIKILMDGKIPTSGTGVYWGHNAHVGRLSYLNAVPGFPTAWGNVGSILNVWLGDAYAPMATLLGSGTFRAFTIAADGSSNYSFGPVATPPASQDSLNSIVNRVSPNKPVFFQTKDISLLNFNRPEDALSGVYLEATPNFFTVQSIPGMSYAGVVSFPASTACHELQ